LGKGRSRTATRTPEKEEEMKGRGVTKNEGTPGGEGGQSRGGGKQYSCDPVKDRKG